MAVWVHGECVCLCRRGSPRAWFGRRTVFFCWDTDNRCLRGSEGICGSLRAKGTSVLSPSPRFCYLHCVKRVFAPVPPLLGIRPHGLATAPREAELGDGRDSHFSWRKNGLCCTSLNPSVRKVRGLHCSHWSWLCCFGYWINLFDYFSHRVTLFTHPNPLEERAKNFKR